MEPPTSSDHAFLVELRRQRAQLRESISALESALAAPTTADGARWAQRVHVALVELSGDFREHVAATEGPSGLYAELSQSAPRLAGSIRSLVEDHAMIRSHLDDLLARAQAPEGDLEGVRARGTDLLGHLVRHRQRGSDLVFEAYEFDVGDGD